MNFSSSATGRILLHGEARPLPQIRRISLHHLQLLSPTAIVGHRRVVPVSMIIENNDEGAPGPSLLGTGDIDTMQGLASTRTPDACTTQPRVIFVIAASAHPSISSGKERDTESGNDYFGARYYASTMGRFLSPDWSAKAEPVPYAKLDNPQTLNLYAYVGNNPLIRTDPTGHYVCNGSKEQCAQIQDGLNAAKAAQAKLGADTKAGKALGAVLKFYGAAGEKNGVNVSFGNLAEGTLGETSAGANGSVNIKFDLKQIDSFGRQEGPLGSWTERAATEIHEGRHGEDARVAGHGPRNRHEEMQTERNAYRTESYVFQGLGVETLTGLWSPSWSPAVAEQNRNAAVEEGAERSTNTACAQGCQP